MIKFLTKANPMIFNSKFTFIPPSCYDLETKPNPVISVTMANGKATSVDLQFRVSCH